MKSINKLAGSGVFSTGLAAFLILFSVQSYSMTDEETEYWKCTQSVIEAGRMTPDEGHFVRDIWTNDGLNAQKCREITKLKHEYDEFNW